MAVKWENKEQKSANPSFEQWNPLCFWLVCVTSSSKEGLCFKKKAKTHDFFQLIDHGWSCATFFFRWFASGFQVHSRNSLSSLQKCVWTINLFFRLPTSTSFVQKLSVISSKPRVFFVKSKMKKCPFKNLFHSTISGSLIITANVQVKLPDESKSLDGSTWFDNGWKKRMKVLFCFQWKVVHTGSQWWGRCKSFHCLPSFIDLTDWLSKHSLQMLSKMNEELSQHRRTTESCFVV